MTTLSKNSPRNFEVGETNDIPVIAAEIIYEGAAVGVVGSSGHARPLSAATNERFAGFCIEKCDNSSGAAAAKKVHIAKSGDVQLSVSGAVITDVGQAIYATNDDNFKFSPESALFVGFVKRFVSSGVVVVEFSPSFVDPWEGMTKEVKSADYTLDAQDNGKVIAVDTDAVVITLPATVVGYRFAIMNLGAYATVGINLSPNANDKIMGPDLGGTDNKDMINTKATAQRGDYIIVSGDGVNGWFIEKMKGVWAAEA